MSKLRILLLIANLAYGPRVVYGQDRVAAAPAVQPSAPKPQGFAGYALGRINPDDTDYGAALDSVRSAVVQQTLGDLFFWSNLLALVLLSVVTTLLLFNLRAADKKEFIAAMLISQLWNGRVSDRKEIERRTEQYNKLVDRHNAEVERGLMGKSQPTPSEEQQATELRRTVESLAGRGNTATLPASGGSRDRTNVAPADRPAAQTAALNQQQQMVLLERRIEAMENTEKNLKERLNQTSALLEQERKRNQALNGTEGVEYERQVSVEIADRFRRPEGLEAVCRTDRSSGEG